MNAIQLQYTSCRKGQSGSAGFQVRTCTPGLSLGESREIERIGSYKIPRNLDPAAPADAIERDFPVLFRFHVLESGRWAITRSTYTGTDYSGRSGNFFAHTLVPEQGATPLWPIDYVEWDGWKTILTPEEDTSDAPPPLQAVSLSDIPPAESFSLNELREFLSEQPSRIEILKRMIRAVFAKQETSRALVIRDTFLNGIFWIACLQKSFPLQYSPCLTFASYQYESRDCETINVSVEETNFAFSDTERKFQFFVFDFETGLHSDVPDIGSEYADKAVEWLTTNPSRLLEFHSFMRFLNHSAVGPDLILAIHLFRLHAGDSVTGLETKIISLIDFCTSFASQEGMGKLLDVLSKAASVSMPKLQAGEGERVIKFFVDSAKATSNEEYRGYAFDLWVRLFDDFVQGQVEWVQVNAGKRIIADTLGGSLGELSNRFLSPAHLESLASLVLKASEVVQLTVIDEVLACQKMRNDHLLWNRSDHANFFFGLVEGTTSVQPIVKRLLVQLQKDNAALLEATFQLDKVLSKRISIAANEARLSLGRALAQILREMQTPDANSVRSRLDQSGLFCVLAGEWLELLDTSLDKKQAMHEYRDRVFSVIPKFIAAQESWVEETYLKTLPPKIAAGEIISTLSANPLSNFTPTFLSWSMDLVNKCISLEPTDLEADKHARVVTDVSRKLNIALKPDKPMLRSCMKGIAIENTDSLPNHLKELSEKDYEIFLTAYLPYAFLKVGDSRAHGAVLKTVLVQGKTRGFESAYRRWVERAAMGRDLSPLAAAVRFSLSKPITANPTDTYAVKRDDILKLQAEGLATAKVSLDALEDKVLGARPGTEVVQGWEKLRKSISSQSSIIGKLKGLFSR